MDEKTYQVLDLISNENIASQREVARRTGISLGMANLILKRLIKTGYIKVRSLNKKNVQYILTPHGIAEKTSRTFQYISKTVRTYEEFVNRARNLVRKLYSQGARKFVIAGDGELSNLISLAIHEEKLNEVSVRKITRDDQITTQNGEVVLNCQADGGIGISVLSAMMGLEEER